MVRIQPDPPPQGRAKTGGRKSDGRKAFSMAPGGLAQLGEHLLCKQGVVGSIPTSSTTTSIALDLRQVHGCEHTVHLVADPSGCRRKSTGHFGLPRKWLLFFNNSWNRIEIVDGKSAGVKACQTPCRQRYYDCVNRYIHLRSMRIRRI